MWNRDISWKWPAAVLLLVLMVVAVLWLLGRNPPRPDFRLVTTGKGASQIKPVDWPWWRRAGDWLHGRKYLMLTFDDGPADHQTNMRILHILEKHHAHAAFFTICKHADMPGRAADLRREVAAGDVIGDHSYTHPKLPQQTAAGLRHQIADCQADLERITGHPVRWFRPPFGQQSSSVLAELQRDGLTDVLWQANSEDSWLKKPAQIEHWSLEEARNDSILLMHSHPTTAAALDRTLTLLENQGYRFVLAQGGM